MNKARPLSPREARVLAFMELRAREPITSVARHCNMQTHSVHFALRSLRHRGVIRDAPIINTTATGHLSFGIYFSVRARGAAKIQELLAHLSALPETLWLTELSGEYQIGLGICVEDAYRLQEIMEQLSAGHSLSIHQKDIVLQWSETRLPRRYLHAEGGKAFRQGPLLMARQGPTEIIDEMDRRILAGLTEQADVSLRSLAASLSLSASTLEWRVNRLKSRGILIAYALEIDATKLGRQRFIIQLFTRGLQESLRTQLASFALKESIVTSIYSCLGPWDFELNVEPRDATEISILTARLLDTFSDQLSHIKVLSVSRVVKHTYSPFSRTA